MSSEINQRAARKQAEKKNFDPKKMLVCIKCGRTVLRTQRIGNPGFEDKIYCTCDERGLPMVPVECDDDE